MLMLDSGLLHPLHGPDAGLHYHDVLPGAGREVYHATSGYNL